MSGSPRGERAGGAVAAVALGRPCGGPPRDRRDPGRRLGIEQGRIQRQPLHLGDRLGLRSDGGSHRVPSAPKSDRLAVPGGGGLGRDGQPVRHLRGLLHRYWQASHVARRCRCCVRRPLLDSLHAAAGHLPVGALPRRPPPVATLATGRLVRRDRDGRHLRDRLLEARTDPGSAPADEPLRCGQSAHQSTRRPSASDGCDRHGRFVGLARREVSPVARRTATADQVARARRHRCGHHHRQLRRRLRRSGCEGRGQRR